MWLHLEQASFRMTPAQYAEKLDSAAQLVNVLGQTDKVRMGQRATAGCAGGHQQHTRNELSALRGARC